MATSFDNANLATYGSANHHDANHHPNHKRDHTESRAGRVSPARDGAHDVDPDGGWVDVGRAALHLRSRSSDSQLLQTEAARTGTRRPSDETVRRRSTRVAPRGNAPRGPLHARTLHAEGSQIYFYTDVRSILMFFIGISYQVRFPRRRPRPPP